MSDNNNNLGSLTKIQYALMDDIYSISKPNDQHQVNVTLLPGVNFTELDIQTGTAFFSESGKDHASGSLFEQHLEFFIMFVDHIKTTFLLDAIRKPVLFIITDGNNNQFIFGSKDNPVFCEWSRVKSTAANEPSKFKVTADRKDELPCYFYTSEKDTTTDS